MLRKRTRFVADTDSINSLFKNGRSFGWATRLTDEEGGGATRTDLWDLHALNNSPNVKHFEMVVAISVLKPYQ